MNWLIKLNPINSLFGRIFLWFWLAAILLVAMGGWIAKQTNDGYSIRRLPAQLDVRVQKIARRLEIASMRRPDANLEFLLGREGQRAKLGLLLVDPRDNSFSYGFPNGSEIDQTPFVEMISQQQPFRLRTSTGEFFGPKAIEVDGQLYYLFAGKPRERGAVQRLIRHNPLLLLFSVIITSGLLCAIFAWTLLKPIRALQNSAKLVSGGDLSQRVAFADSREDELGELGRDFNTMTSQIESLVGSQKRLVADISHELRSPLARLQLAIGIAQEQVQDLPPHLQTHLLRIEKEAQQINAMIEQVLKLSRLEAQAPVESRQDIHLPILLEAVFDDAIYEAQTSKVQVHVAPIPDIIVHCFPNLYVSAVLNVITNAIKYCESKVDVSFFNDNKWLDVIIEDDGKGVPEQDIEKMFEPFYRLSTSRSRDSGGVGLGLAIVKQAIAAHAGRVVAENKPTSGLRVILRIPLTQHES